MSTQLKHSTEMPLARLRAEDASLATRAVVEAAARVAELWARGETLVDNRDGDDHITLLADEFDDALSQLDDVLVSLKHAGVEP